MFHFVTDIFGKATASDNLRMNFLYYRTTVKIIWRSFLAKAGSVWGIRLFLSLLLICPSVLPAQEIPWPWELKENLQITRNLELDFMPSIAASPNLYLIVWTRKTPSGLDIYGATVTTSDPVVVSDAFPICTAPDDQTLSSVLWDEDNFFVVWQDRRSGKRWEIYGARVTSDGRVLDRVGGQAGILIGKGKSSSDQTSPALAFDGDNYMVVWQGKRKSTWNIYFARVTKATGDVFDPIPIQVDSARSNAASPAVTFGGEDYLVVWQDSRNGRWDIYGARISPSTNQVLDPGGILIGPADKNVNSGDKWKPAVSWDGDFFLVTWMTLGQDKIWLIEGERVDTEGKPADLINKRLIKEGTNKGFPAVQWTGEEHLLVWEDDPGEESTISGASIFPAYKPFQETEAKQISSPDVKKASFPKIGQMGNEAIVVWQGLGSDGSWQIYGSRLQKVPEIDQTGTNFE